MPNQWDGVITLPARRLMAHATLAGSGQVITGVTGKKIRVIAAAFGAAAPVVVNFASNATDISPSFHLASNGGVTLPENSSGWFETAAGEALNLEASAGVSVGVEVTYELV